ncbi:MAG: V-type ATP synthase subunit F [Lentisphaeria bacterium]
MSFHIIGDKDSLMGYAFAGVRGDAVDDADQAREALSEVKRKGTARILIVTKPVAEMIEAELTEHRLSCQPPFIVEVGDLWNTPVERRSLEEMIYGAVGIRLHKTEH